MRVYSYSRKNGGPRRFKSYLMASATNSDHGHIYGNIVKKHGVCTISCIESCIESNCQGMAVVTVDTGEAEITHEHSCAGVNGFEAMLFHMNLNHDVFDKLPAEAAYLENLDEGWKEMITRQYRSYGNSKDPLRVN